MEWNDSAIVLQVGRFREADLWLKLLFRNKGLVTAFAFGGSRSRRRFCGCLDVLNTISCRVKQGRQGQYLTLEEGVLVRGPQKLRSEWASFGMLMNCVRFLDALPMAYDGGSEANTGASTGGCTASSSSSGTSSIGTSSIGASSVGAHSHDLQDSSATEKHSSAPAAFALMQDMLSLMEGMPQDAHTHTKDTNAVSGDSMPAMVPVAPVSPHPLHPVLFRLRMACELGFTPAWQECAQCGGRFERQHVLFRMDEGTCVCAHCAPRAHSPYALNMSASALHFLHSVQHTPPTMWDVHALPNKDRQTCFRAVDGFTQFHLGIAWDAGRFKRV